MKRLLTALVLMPLVWAVIFHGPPLLLIAVMALVAGFCFFEYVGIVRAHGIPLSYWSAIPGLCMLWLGQSPASSPIALVWLVVLSLLGMIMALRTDPVALMLPCAGSFVLGTLYIFGPWCSGIALWLRSPHWLLFALASNWIGDSAAFYVGRSLGRHKLAPRISPGKSVEGAVGAWIVTIIFASLYLHWAVGLDYLLGALIGVVVNPVGQLGDLAESALKRGANLKDSGNLLPGHGGWLDRLDSSLFTLPVTHALVQLLGL